MRCSKDLWKGRLTPEPAAPVMRMPASCVALLALLRPNDLDAKQILPVVLQLERVMRHYHTTMT